MSKTLLVLAILAAVAVGAYFYIHRHPGPPDIAFGADGVDFAQLEAKIPLSPVDLDRVTPDSLKSLTHTLLPVRAAHSPGYLVLGARPLTARSEQTGQLELHRPMVPPRPILGRVRHV